MLLPQYCTHPDPSIHFNPTSASPTHLLSHPARYRYSAGPLDPPRDLQSRGLPNYQENSDLGAFHFLGLPRKFDGESNRSRRRVGRATPGEGGECSCLAPCYDRSHTRDGETGPGIYQGYTRIYHTTRDIPVYRPPADQPRPGRQVASGPAR